VPEYEDYIFEMWTQGDFNEYWQQLGICNELYFDQYSDVPQMHMGSWYDPYTKTTTRNFTGLGAIKKSPIHMILGPWTHGAHDVSFAGDVDFGPQSVVSGDLADDYNDLRLRWFDHWLKDVPNGVMDEPPVHFETSEPSGSTVWKSAPRLPLPEAQPRTFYLSSETSGTIASVNDGSLSQAAGPEPTEAKYDVDHSVSLGMLNRHSYYVDDVFIDTVDLVARGQRCLTFTTPPLEAGVEVTGAPAVDLEIATTADRGAIVATLEQVQADGSVAYLTEGFLNFEHRRTGDAETGHDGPFWHSYRSADLQPVRPNEPMRLQLELYPISCILREGDGRER